MECVLARANSEVGIVTLSECSVGVCFERGLGSVGIMPGVFARVTRWCVRGARRIWVGALGMDKFWFLVVGVGVMFSTVVPIFLANRCNASPWRP